MLFCVGLFVLYVILVFFFFSSRRRHTRCLSDWSSDVCSSDLPITTKYLFVASMDVDPDKEELFNEVYDTEHVPNLLKVPGVHAVTRIKGEPFTVSIGGAEQQVTHTGPRYSALYEIEGPHVLVSAAWAEAVELGRWPSQV